MNGTASSLLATLRAIAGSRHVLTGVDKTRRFRMGFRSVEGDALAVVRPGTLSELWQVTQACAEADVAIIAQAANTGLTGGSTPAPGGYGRPAVIVSTMRLKGAFPINGGGQVVCLPGSTLHELERMLRPLGREPHSVIGSSCFGASVIGGVCNNSGGALVRRGPAYTEYALYAQSMPDGGIRLVNHLGVDLGEEPLAMLARLESGDFDPTAANPRRASDGDYAAQVRDVDADSPARHNADPRCLHEASGSAGKLMVFAVRLDTFAREAATRTFYLGCTDPARLGQLRRTILTSSNQLPVAAEYLHAEAFDLADRYGKDQFLMIDWLGTDRLPRFFDLKSRIDGVLARVPFLPANLLDRLLYAASRLWPDHLPPRMREWRARCPHHLLLKVSADAADEMLTLLRRWAAGGGFFFECSEDEARKAFLHRFVIAGAAVRYQAVHPHKTAGIVALDIALRRNDREWFETLPPEVADKILHRIYYGHFLCHVLHQDYVVAAGADPKAIKDALLRLLDERGARYPAEHNFGHAYTAPPELAAFHAELDPANRFNPGIGGTSRLPNHG